MFSQTNEAIIHSMHDARTAYGITLFPASYGRRPAAGDGSMRCLAQSTAPKVFCRNPSDELRREKCYHSR
jgi:hypothetical protein